MLGSNWYHQISKLYTIAFAHLFSDLYIYKFNNNNEITSSFKVPILYMAKSKMYAIKTTNQKTSGFSNIFPRMTFRIDNITSDPDRQKNKLNSYFKINDTGKANRIKSPKPVNYKFILSIFTRNTDDAFALIEQISPFFMPELTLPIKEILPMNITSDVKIVMDDNININDPDEVNAYDFDDDVNRVDIGFTLYGHLWPPIKLENMINKIKIKIGLVNDTEVEIDPNDVLIEEISI